MQRNRRPWRRTGENVFPHRGGSPGPRPAAAPRGAIGIVGRVVGSHLHRHAVHAHAEGRGLRRGTGARSPGTRHRRLRRGVSGRQPERLLPHPDRQRAALRVEAGDVQLPVARGGAGRRTLRRAAAARRAGRRRDGHPGGRLRRRRAAGHQRHAGADGLAGARRVGRRDLRCRRGVAGGAGCREPRVRRSPVQRRGRSRGAAGRRRLDCADRALRRRRRRGGAAALALRSARGRQDLHALRLSRQSDAAAPRRCRSRARARRGASADRHHARLLGLSPRQLPHLPRRRRCSATDRARPAPEWSTRQLRERHRPWIRHRRGRVAQRRLGGRSNRTDRARARRRFLDRTEPAAAGRAAGAAGILVRRLRGRCRGRRGRDDEQQALQGHRAGEEHRGTRNPVHRFRLLRPGSRRVPQRAEPTDRAVRGRRPARRRRRSGRCAERSGDAGKQPRANHADGRHAARGRHGIERAGADARPALGKPLRRRGDDGSLSGVRHPLRRRAVPRPQRAEAHAKPRAPGGAEGAATRP